MKSNRCTKIWRVDKENPSREQLQPAIDALLNGEIIAIPTETVYGLAAVAVDVEAVKKIFTVKGRPMDNPLIVHIASTQHAEMMMHEKMDTNVFHLLAKHFWPGPLTMVAKKAPDIPLEVTAGLDSVALRMPKHPVALQLIRYINLPLAAPSANRSGRPSPTTANHVLDDLKGLIEGVVDGGQTEIGLESTVVDITTSPITLLRPGGTTLEALKEVLGYDISVDPFVLALGNEKRSSPIRSPGTKYKHYAPRIPLLLYKSEKGIDGEFLQQLLQCFSKDGLKAGLLLSSDSAAFGYDGPLVVFGSRENPKELASNLFAALRSLEEENIDILIVEGVKAVGIGLAIMNRLHKAATVIIERKKGRQSVESIKQMLKKELTKK